MDKLWDSPKMWYSHMIEYYRTIKTNTATLNNLDNTDIQQGEAKRRIHDSSHTKLKTGYYLGSKTVTNCYNNHSGHIWGKGELYV